MSGTFSGLNTARTALWAQQRALDVTGQNIANINTEGYSRQRAELQSLGGTAVPATYAVSNNVGEGVSAEKIARIRDAFLEGRAQTEQASTATLTVADDTLAQIEQAFREPGDTGIQAQLSDMWAAWGDVHNNSTDPGARSEVLQRTETLVAGIRTTRAALDQQWTDDYENLSTLVDDVNATAASIADLNVAIRRATQSGLPSNELVDKRDVLVLKLSQQVGATSSPAEDGGITVAVGGATLVSGGSTLKLALLGSSDPDDLAGDPPRIVTSPGTMLVRAGGTAEGKLTAMTSTIPQYRTSIDDLARQLATQLNDVHDDGYDDYGVQGGPLLDDGSGAATVDLTAITAANLTMRITDPRKLAAASLAPVPDPAGGMGTVASGDNSNADRIYQLGLTSTGTDATYRKMIVSLGVEAATATNRLTTQSVISSQVDASRESVAGVNLDEEMSNLLQFQHGYAAAGQLVSAINSMLDTLINMVR
ncbi:flagellar hook-associated protein FlgK [Geodermatophilus sp. URMC 64]